MGLSSSSWQCSRLITTSDQGEAGIDTSNREQPCSECSTDSSATWLKQTHARACGRLCNRPGQRQPGSCTAGGRPTRSQAAVWYLPKPHCITLLLQQA
jgi:hypothetical protein